MHAPCGDILHPSHYPALMSNIERPEPYYGLVKIVEEHPTVDGQCMATRYADGRYAMVPRGYVLEPGTVTNNGPACMPWDEIRGNISDSEGMDCPNYMFNNTDCGASF